MCEACVLKKILNLRLITNIDIMNLYSFFFENERSFMFKPWVVVVIEIITAYDVITSCIQVPCKMKPYKTSDSSYKDFLFLRRETLG